VSLRFGQRKEAAAYLTSRTCFSIPGGIISIDLSITYQAMTRMRKKWPDQSFQSSPV
jgi:hypothetical protein